LKDELPDLTPYLNKKGGNSQGRGEENPPGKADISQKLSALVKKPGTNSGSHPSLPAAMTPQYMQEPAASPAQPPAPEAQPAPAPQFSPEPESSIGIIKKPTGETAAPPLSDNIGLVPKVGSNGQSKATGWGSLGNFSDDYDAPPSSPATPPAVPSSASASNSSTHAPSPSPSPSPSSSEPVSLPNTGASASQTNLQPPASSSPSREMPKPGQAVALDKLKMPQAKPMSTLSSSSAPSLLKTPIKQPGRPAQPYNYKPVIEPGREAMAPKAPAPAVNNKAPQPLPPKPATAAPAVSPLATPTQPQYQGANPPAPAANSLSSSSSSSVAGSGPTSNFSASQAKSPAAPSSSSSSSASSAASKPFRVETDAEKLARAFQEEAQALQASSSQAGQGASFASAPISFDDTDAMDENVDETILNNSFFEDEGPVNAQTFQAKVESPQLGDEFRPAYTYEEEFVPEAPAPAAQAYPEARSVAPETGPKASLSNLFDSGVLNSRYEQDAPKKPLGFGNLLAGSGPAPTDESHTAFADLMVPTGEHDALLAPDRHQDSGASAFDEISAQLDADANYAAHAAAENSSAFDMPAQYSAPEDSFRAEEKTQPPAFSSLFSSEIVTSGQDFSTKWSNPQSAESEPGASLDSDLLEPTESADANSLQGYLADFQPEAEATSAASSTEPDIAEESYSQSPKSLAISKLLEAVNQKDDAPSSLFSSEIVGASSDAAGIQTSASDYAPAEAKVDQDQATLESWLSENMGGGDTGAIDSGEIVGATSQPDTSSAFSAPSDTSEADAEAARNAAALEALAAFAPKQGEEQHETKGLLKKLKAKEQAEKAARKAEADAKAAGAGEAGAAKSEAEPVKKSSLSSLLSGSSDLNADAKADQKVDAVEPPAVVPKMMTLPPATVSETPFRMLWTSFSEMTGPIAFRV
jgi:hypothetical protein